MTDRRLLAVHAHPDDETLSMGATMARYVAAGDQVTLVTCTLGEEGEVVVPELGHLASDRDDALGAARIDELAAACAALGVTDHRFLGGPGRWRDSGMIGTPQNDRPDCFWRADMTEATAQLVAVIREIHPQVAVTYDENGGYGHPDHIQAHRVTVAALEAAADPAFRPDLGTPWTVERFYYTALPKSVLISAIALMKEKGHAFLQADSVDDLPFGTPDELVTTEVDATAFLANKEAAMRAHVTQISTDGPFFALADGVGQNAFALEYFTLVRGERGPGVGEKGYEAELFAAHGV